MVFVEKREYYKGTDILVQFKCNFKVTPCDYFEYLCPSQLNESSILKTISNTQLFNLNDGNFMIAWAAGKVE